MFSGLINGQNDQSYVKIGPWFSVTSLHFIKFTNCRYTDTTCEVNMYSIMPSCRGCMLQPTSDLTHRIEKLL